MKRFMSLFLSCIFVLGVCFSTPVVANATDGEGVTSSNTIESADCVYTITKAAEESIPGECELTEYKGSASSIDIISSVEDTQTNTEYTVTSIGAEAFKDNVSIVQIIIPETVVTIDEGALTDCENLKYVVLKSDVPALVLNEIPQSVAVHYSDCAVKGANAYTVEGAVITEYCSCGTEENPVPRGTATLVCTDVLYGQTYSAEIVVEGTFEETLIGEDFEYFCGEEKLDSKPTEVNENDEKYTVKYSFDLAESETVTVAAEYSISYLDSVNTYQLVKNPVGVEGYAKIVTVNAEDGYYVSTVQDGTYGPSIDFSEAPIRFYVKRSQDGATSDVVTVSDITFDLEGPSVEFKIDDKKLEETIYCKDSATVEVVVTDNENGSGVNEIKYYIGNEETVTDELTDDDWQALEDDMVSITEPGEYVIYIKATDNVGNETIVGSSVVVIYNEAKIDENSQTVSFVKTTTEDVKISLDSEITVTNVEFNSVDLTTDECEISTENEKTVIRIKADYLNSLEQSDDEKEYEINFTCRVADGVEYVVEGSISVLKKSIEEAEITFATIDLTYDGAEKKPAITVKVDGKELTENDFEATYVEDLISAGEKTVTVAGKGNYCGSATANYEIEKKTISISEIVVESREYNGGLDVQINDSLSVLSGIVDADDVKLSLGNVTATIDSADAGERTVAFVGTPSLTGEDANNYILDTTLPETTVVITAKEITDENITLDKAEFVFNGSAQKPVITLTVDDRILGDEDFTVSYLASDGTENNCVNVGTVIVIATGVGNYRGEARATYRITKAQSSLKAPEGGVFEYDGTEQELLSSCAQVIDCQGTIYYSLTGNDNDWSSDVPKARNVGKYKVWYKLVGIDGNYEDIEKAFVEAEIIQRGISIGYISVADRDYDGSTVIELGDGEAILLNVIDGETVLVDLSEVTARVENASAGLGKIVTFDGVPVLKGDDADNYKFVENPLPSNVTVDINKKTVDVSIEDATVEQYGEMPEFKCTVDSSALLTGDEIEIILTTDAKDTKTAGEYTISVGGFTVKNGENAVTSNYKINATDAKLTITEHTKHIWENGACKACEKVCEHSGGNATCLELAVCEICGMSYGSKAEHNWGPAEPVKDATCTEKGLMKLTCLVTGCGKGKEIEIKINENNHDWSTQWEVVTKQTCKTPGEEKQVCGNGCKKTQTREIEADGKSHKLGDEVVTKATCVAEGRCVSVCEIDGCGYEEAEILPVDKDAHNLPEEWEETKQPNCVEAGEKIKKCLNKGCEFFEKDEIPADGKTHNLGDGVVTIEPGCTVKGELTQYCQNGDCNYKVSVSIKPDGKTHKFADEFTIVDSTCIATGVKYKACLNPDCTAKSEETIIEINPTAHNNITTINAKLPTCTEKGYTGDEYCNDCKKIVDPGIDIDAKGHTEGEWIIDKEATFEETGSKHKECTVCKEKLVTETVEKLTLATPKVKIYNSSNGIKVKWNEIDNALSYSVFRSEEKSDGKWTGWKKVSSVKYGKTSVTDKTVKEGTHYRYTVKAYNGSYKSVVESSNHVFYIKSVKPSVSVNTKGIVVNWSANKIADSYVVLRSQLVNGNWSDWTEITKTTTDIVSFTDSNVVSGETYRYAIRIVKSGDYSYLKASSDMLFLGRPKLKTSNTESGIKGTWELINGASGYSIYREQYNLKTKKYEGKVHLGTTGATTKSFIDKSAQPGVKYCYTIVAVNGSTSSVASSAKKLWRLTQPQVTVSTISDGVKGTWTQVAGAKSYTIYRCELVDGSWTKWQSLGDAKATAKTFTDKTVKSGITYKYTVKARSTGSTSSVKGSEPIIFLSIPVATVSARVGAIDLSWGQVNGATKYIVYRSERGSDGKWTSYKKQVSLGGSSLAWTDLNVEANKRYKYKVKAYNDSAKSSTKATKSVTVPAR